MAEPGERVLVARGHRIAKHDLYAVQFDPVQSAGEAVNATSSDPLVEQHCAEIFAPT
jgi:NAD(P)H dehydrogenase (quinone)